MLDERLNDFRRRLASPEAALPFALLGIFAGLLTAGVITAFRLALELPLTALLPGNSPENFEALPRYWHFLLPVLGAAVLGLLLHKVSHPSRLTGIPHVIAALHHGRGKLPPANLAVQFIGGLLALLSGQSGGREGPAVHIGAATSSLCGRQLRLPNNSLRVLAACGTAAAIAASFNTPIAGVIFAMEVVMMEYTVAGFVPVMLASVTATTVSQAVFGDIVFLPTDQFAMASLLELPFIALLGLGAGVLSGLFVRLQRRCLRWITRPVLQRMLIAGTVTGLCALIAPEVLGIGYDSLQAAVDGDYTWRWLIVLLVLKLLATAVSCGMGMPIGIIGPSLLVGAFGGALLGSLGSQLFPELAAGHGFYVLLGMAATMGAVLNAPLAALLALIELTHNLNMIFPAMLAVVAAQLMHREVFGLQSAHQTTLDALQQAVRTDPLLQTLLRTSAAAVMDRNLRHVPPVIDREELEALTSGKPVRWLVITNQEGKRIAIHREHWFPVLNALDAGTAEKGAGTEAAKETDRQADEQNAIDLLALIEQRQRTASFDINGTLLEALDTMNQAGLDTLFVSNPLQRRGPPDERRGPLDEGILTRTALSEHYNLPIRF